MERFLNNNRKNYEIITYFCKCDFWLQSSILALFSNSIYELETSALKLQASAVD